MKLLSDIQASQRTTAKVLGVSKETIARDLEKRDGGTNVPLQKIKDNEITELKNDSGTNVPPILQSPSKVARLAEKELKKEEAKIRRERRIEEEKRAEKEFCYEIEIRNGDFKEVLSDLQNIDAIG